MLFPVSSNNSKLYILIAYCFFMENLDQLESNVQGSFRNVKNDVSGLRENLVTISQNQVGILRLLEELQKKEQTLYQMMKKQELKSPVNSRSKKYFVASKTGKTFHEVNCPFGKNIKRSMKLIFKRKNTALNAGYKPCKCVKL